MQQGSIYEDVILSSAKKWSFLEFARIFKEVKLKKKISRQSLAKGLQTFPRFNTIYLQHNWIGTRLLSIKVRCKSCQKQCTTQKLNFCICPRNFKKPAVNYFKGKPILLNFVNLSTTFCPWFSRKNEKDV